MWRVSLKFGIGLAATGIGVSAAVGEKVGIGVAATGISVTVVVGEEVWVGVAATGISLTVVVGEEVGVGVAAIDIGVTAVVGEEIGVGVAVTGIGVNVVAGEKVGVTEDGILEGVGDTSMAFVVTFAVYIASAGLDLGAGGFVGSGLGGSFGRDGSSCTLAATLASGVGVSSI